MLGGKGALYALERFVDDFPADVCRELAFFWLGHSNNYVTESGRRPMRRDGYFFLPIIFGVWLVRGFRAPDRLPWPTVL